ncbi:MAG TPA: M14 family zinc carboxypeptidase, partial [Chloroflexota bacterium]|nr:M14 family zinc carboxypeptidase [Chloroflexota bacterium]
TLLVGQPTPRQVHVGRSGEGRPIDAYLLGDGPLPILIIGGMHGAPELNSSAVVWEMLDAFASSEPALQPGVALVFLPEANPDGLADGTRELADGVDANRNWPTADWRPETYGPGGTWLADGGGDQPLSEPETVALAEFVARLQPIAVFSYHSAAGIAMGGSASDRTGLLAAYAAASGYPTSNFLAYPVTGDFAQWLDEQDIPTVEVELTDHWRSEVERNLAGVQAVLERIIVGPPDAEPDADPDPSY